MRDIEARLRCIESDELIWRSMMKRVLFAFCLLLPLSVMADFQESAVPTAIYHMPCDGSPRLVIAFSSPTASIWYPANGQFAKEFLAIALAAKASSSPLFFYGNGSANNLTPYCIGIGYARQVYMVGVQ